MGEIPNNEGMLINMDFDNISDEDILLAMPQLIGLLSDSDKITYLSFLQNLVKLEVEKGQASDPLGSAYL